VFKNIILINVKFIKIYKLISRIKNNKTAQ